MSFGNRFFSDGLNTFQVSFAHTFDTFRFLLYWWYLVLCMCVSVFRTRLKHDMLTQIHLQVQQGGCLSVIVVLIFIFIFFFAFFDLGNVCC